jgi:3-hydroxyisobutyrate dehydrogenase-like beta-hydroxyacid dehydrogenase
MNKTIGFIGLGVMGEPICRNLAEKCGAPVFASDLNQEPLKRLQKAGVKASGVEEIMTKCSVIFLSLPSGEIVEKLCRDANGLLQLSRPGQTIIDLSTSAVSTTRALASDFLLKNVEFIDAPVARTRAAAESGTLAVMVGAKQDVFERVHRLISTFASDIALCGDVGCGQVVKILNNMVLFQTVLAFSEAKAIGEKFGVNADVLFDTFSKGSADSFALRNQGMKSVAPGSFPTKAFSVEYARKDLTYAMRMANDAKVDARGAKTVDYWFQRAIDAGKGDQYYPVVSSLLGVES